MPPAKLRHMTSNFQGPGNKARCRNFAKVLLTNFILFLMVTLYSVFGAYLFIVIESGNEQRLRQLKILVAQDAEDSLEYIISLLWYQNTQNLTKTQYSSMVMSNLNVLQQFVVQKASDPSVRYDGYIYTWDYVWTYPKAIFFTITTIASIGYGNVVPKTFMGRLVTILYSVVGIPMLLVALANVGECLADACRYIYSRMCCRWCRVKRKFSELKKKTPQKGFLWNDDVGYESYMPTQKVNVPIVVNLFVITVYAMMCGILFCWWEQWDFMSAIYFTFITLTTIGFGDLVPGNHDGDGLSAIFKMFVTCLICFVGMALLSMCINLMQEQLIVKTRWMLMELGIMEEDIDPMEKYKYKKSKKGTVLETHKDRDGNKRLSLMNADEGESTASKPKTYSNIKEELEDM
ncbi:TWiK family of potassium channels protein 7-like isoform X2 [Cherax quadricarinatus]|uniref:TWiK family of potassium channels protein 7-like isoform X2 n=1 Tax=Cherax quadricarinatus TaxID=27406 RepID=UPI00387E2997